MKAFIEIHLKLVVTIWLILFSVLGLLLMMNYMKFSSMMSNVVSSQLQVISSSIQRSIIKAEQLGLPLAEMQNLPLLLQREQARDPQIQNIFIIDVSAKILFRSSGDASQNMPIQNNLLRKATTGKEQQWSIESDTQLYSGLKLLDATEQLMGNIIIIYNKQGYLAISNQVFYQLINASIAIFVLFALLVFLAVRWGFSDVNNVLKVINSQLKLKQTAPLQQALKPDTLAYQFARQIEQREKMKRHVSEQLDACCSGVKETQPSSGSTQ